MAEDDEDDDLDEPMPELDDLVVEGDDPDAPELDPRVLQRFFSRQKALDVAAAAVKGIVPAQEVNNIAAEAVIRAFRARKPPHLEAVIPAWLATIARRVAGKWLEKRKRRAKYEGPMPSRKKREDDYTGHRVETHPEPVGNFFDADGPEDPNVVLIDPFMDTIVAPHDRAILELLRKQAQTGMTYAQLAAERGESEPQLRRKIKRFKVKYTPRVKRRNAMVFWFKRGALTAVGLFAVGLVLYFVFLRPAPKGDVLPDPATRPLPSATVSADVPLIAEQQKLRDARDLRASAFTECREKRWTECLRRLDAAKTLDPAGDQAPEVQGARLDAQDGLEGKKR